MKFKNEDLWKKGLANNQDSYGAATYEYAEAWANLMEAHMAEGIALQECAKKDSQDANTDRITGFMYGCAVGLLASVWEHGEGLRRWHNLDTQVKDEGEKANEKGTVLNPALLNINC